MWTKMASKLAPHTCTSKNTLAMKRYHTLEEAYKRVKDNNRMTGHGRVEFQFYAEMFNLLGRCHNVDFPVVGRAGDMGVHNE